MQCLQLTVFHTKTGRIATQIATSRMNAEEKIRALIETARTGGAGAPISKTRQVLNLLDEIEEAIRVGIPRRLIAEQLDMRLPQFAQALKRARHQRQKQLGNGNRQPPQPMPSSSPFGSGSDFGGLRPFDATEEK